FRVNRSDDCGQSWDRLGPSVASTTQEASLSRGVPVQTDPAQTFLTDLCTEEALAEGLLPACFGNPQKEKVARALSSDAWIAVAPSDGTVYVAYVSRDSSGFAQIYVAQSPDQGMTWNSTRVTDGHNSSAYPEIAVANNGTIGVLYVEY